MFPLIFVGFGTALLLTKTVPAPVALALVVGGVMFPLSRIPSITGLAVACDLMLLVALTAVAVTTRSAEVEQATRAVAS